MSTPYIIALSLVIIAIVAIVIAAVVASKKVKPTLNKMDSLSENIEDAVDRYGKEGQAIQDRIEKIQERVALTQVDAQQKIGSLDELQDQFQSLSASLAYLKDQSQDFSQSSRQNLTDKIKEEGPAYFKLYQKALKGTFKKQKERYS